MRKMLLLAAVAFTAAVIVAVSPGTALAYGHNDQPLAQLTLSANCDNSSFFLCASSEQGGVGLGGIWAWVELDAGGTGDMTGAACGHVQGGGGPGSAGAGPLGPTSITWEQVSGSQIPDGFFVLGTDPNNQYYIVNELGGFAFPVTTGHYSTRLAPGVQIQATVAP